MVGTEKGKVLFYAAWLPLYSRLHKEKLADTGPRFQLLQLIADRPGIHLQLIVTESGISRGACTYHLQVLEREGYIHSRREGRLKRFHRTGANGITTTSDLERTLSPTATNILHLIENQHGLTQNQIATELSISRELTRYHLTKIAHLVTSTRDGRELRYTPGTQDQPPRPLRTMITDALARNPGMAPSQLANEFGVTPPAISYQVRLLEDAGRVERVREGRNVRLFLKDRT